MNEAVSSSAIEENASEGYKKVEIAPFGEAQKD